MINEDVVLLGRANSASFISDSVFGDASSLTSGSVTSSVPPPY